MRRSGIKIMASLVSLLGSLAYIMLLAVINGSLGFVCAIGVTVLGAVGVAKILGESIALSYGLIAGLAVGLGLLRGLLRYLEQYSNHYIAFRLLAALRYKIFGALRLLCPAKLESKQKGSIIAMITSDIEMLEVFYAHTVSPIFIAIVVSAGAFIFTGFVSDWFIAFAALAGYIIIGVIFPFIGSAAVKKPGMRYRGEFASFNAYFLDSIKGVKDIILNNAHISRAKEVDRRSDVLLAETNKLNARITLASGITQTAMALIIAATLLIGIALTLNTPLTFGRMLIGVVTVFSSFGPVIALSALSGNLTQTFAAGDRVLNLIAEEPVVRPVDKGADFDFETLNVKELTFGYGSGDVIKDINISAHKGEIVGIVGESGCGKSTLLKLLMRFWQKDRGAIEYNGLEIDTVLTDALLKNVTMVSQTTYLFNDTIKGNLLIAKPDATDGQIISACQKASIHDFIITLPEGYDTGVGELGDRLSAGEKQRIGLARAFLHDSPLILLDEPTSNVDSINEGIILKALKDQKADRSIILVSHRESTMAIADRTYKIKDGQIVNG
jgi:ATP-binding cassette subfamily C protein